MTLPVRGPLGPSGQPGCTYRVQWLRAALAVTHAAAGGLG